LQTCVAHESPSESSTPGDRKAEAPSGSKWYWEVKRSPSEWKAHKEALDATTDLVAKSIKADVEPSLTTAAWLDVKKTVAANTFAADTEVEARVAILNQGKARRGDNDKRAAEAAERKAQLSPSANQQNVKSLLTS
jgi:hypothetical protein